MYLNWLFSGAFIIFVFVRLKILAYICTVANGMRFVAPPKSQSLPKHTIIDLFLLRKLSTAYGDPVLL